MGPMTVALPAWDNFEGFDNVVDVKPKNDCPLYSHSCEITLQGADEGWLRMLSVREQKRSGMRSIFQRLGRTPISNNSLSEFEDSKYINRSDVSHATLTVLLNHTQNALNRSTILVSSSLQTESGPDFGAMLDNARQVFETRNM